MRLGLGCLAAIGAACLAAGPAYGAEEIKWQASLAGDDGPSLGVVLAPAGATLEVFRCPGGGLCDARSLPVTQATDAVDVSTAQAGDVFEGRLTQNGVVVASGRTAPWIGPATPTSAPSVQGAPIAGGTVTAVPGRWVGGWGDAWSGGVGTEVVVCRTAAGSDCRRLGGSPTTVGATDVGGYLFALSSYGSGFSSGPVPPMPPLPPTFPTIGPNTATFTASAPVGTVVPVASPVPPTATLRARALRRNHQLSLGRVTCPAVCAVKLTVSGGGKTVRRTLTVTGTKALTIPPRHGKLKVTVTVDGKKLASGVLRTR
jgi:hypothetical protein